MCPNCLKFLQAIFFVWVFAGGGFAINIKLKRHISKHKCIEREGRALLGMKQSLVDDYGILSSWGEDEDSNCCNWWGVKCSIQTGHVLTLDLHAHDQDQPLRGEISASLLELQHLNYMDFSWNDFHGNPIPEFIGSLISLRYLNLSHASFSGKIPPQLGNLSSLQYLYLQTNYLVGDIPWQLGNLSKLEQLSLYHNHLFGIIPHQLGNLSRLKLLFLGSNDNLQIDISNTKNIMWISCLSSLTELELDNVSNLRKSKNWLQMIGQLPNLQFLSLANCSLSGIDMLLGHPSKLNFSSSLKGILLNHNMFTSSIFPWFYNFNSSLTIIDLGGNLLKGPIPNDLGRIMHCLQTLYLDNNQLTGNIPNTIANLSQLIEFDVRGNSLEGEIKNLVHFANLTKLKSLALSENSFTLKFSNNWIPQFQLHSLELQSCTLGPSFPKWLQMQNDLSYVDVSNAGISDTATMASFLCFAKSLTFFNMSSNQFKGKLPDCLNHLKSLRIIDLSNNQFSGKIPTSMGSLFLVRHLILRNNHFTGQLPSLQNCTNLVMLDVGRNELLGPIPPLIAFNLPKLQVLSLRKNYFNGTFPLHFCHLTNIQVLDLSLNNLTGQIPKCVQNFSAMTQESSFTEFIDQFFIFKNGYPIVIAKYDFYPTVRWKGKELSFKDNKRLLKLIDLSGNGLFGNIPREMGNLLELVSLDLSSNNLSGQIPWDLGNLYALEFLDLSKNHLSGAIPSSLSKIDWLSALNLSDNNLSGKIPSGTQLQSFDASVYGGNPNLCGSPLKILCLNEKESRDPLMFTKHEEDLDTYFTKGFYISMSLGFAAGFWAIFGSLILFHSWRHAYFTFLYNFYERIDVITRINIARWHKLLER